MGTTLLLSGILQAKQYFNGTNSGKRSRRRIGAEGCPSAPYWPLSTRSPRKPPWVCRVWRGGIQMRRRRETAAPSVTMLKPSRAGTGGSGIGPMLMFSRTACSRIGRVGGFILNLVIASERAALAYAGTPGANSKTGPRMPLVKNWSASLPSPAWKYCNPRADQIAGIVTQYACSTE